ncbi:unnamed protein product [Diabrotica balteata]|uniref:XK-related protein n=1 Tax=Diabrotica balteata TaxID=107213 RepID=A0A9N9TAA3_DIABA|nr:unnamed protein product [Diabrotica balteata]
MVTGGNDGKKQTLLGYELTSCEDAIVNYLVPSVSACILYILLIAVDVGVIFSHFKNDDPIWASLTLFILYVPALISFVLVVSNWALWPEFESCGRENMIWFWTKLGEHFFFPVWSIWRFAERIFWSIEAVRAKDEQSFEEAVSIITSPRSIELYVFLQSYTHALPQVLLQLYILTRNNTEMNRQTEKVQTLCLVLNLLKLAVTTTYYQRFKSQKLTGKQYPWYKRHKDLSLAPNSTNEVVLRKPIIAVSRNIIERSSALDRFDDQYNIEPPRYSELSRRRRSSDLYLEPTSSGLSNRHTLLETDFDVDIQTKIKVLDESVDEVDTYTSPTYPPILRETSIADGPKRPVYRGTEILDYSEPDFNISRIMNVKGLEDDDLAGKLVATVWWFAFLLARVLTITVFAYFYFKETIYILTIHVILITTILVYDVKSDEVKRAKAVFFLFIGLIFIFCIIEFKIKFKKATKIFYGFFALIFFENMGMCLAWYVGQVESLENDFWFRYVFYIIIACSILSFSTMVFYFGLNKPPSVVVATTMKQ